MPSDVLMEFLFTMVGDVIVTRYQIDAGKHSAMLPPVLFPLMGIEIGMEIISSQRNRNEK